MTWAQTPASAGRARRGTTSHNRQRGTGKWNGGSTRRSGQSQVRVGGVRDRQPTPRRWDGLPSNLKEKGDCPLFRVAVGVEVFHVAPAELFDAGFDLGAVARDDPH